MSGNFAPGQLIKCIRDDWFPVNGPIGSETCPVKGHVYEVSVPTRFLSTGESAVRLVGFRHKWVSAAFRPVDPRRLEIFRKALTGRPLETEDA